MTAGRLTQAQEDTILAALPARLDQEINEVHTGGPGGGPGGPPPTTPTRRRRPDGARARSDLHARSESGFAARRDAC